MLIKKSPTYSGKYLPAGSRKEWITPFDSMFDEVLSAVFPSAANELGGDFFLKGAYPKVNVISKEDSVIIEAAIPGMQKEDISIEIMDNILTISGRKNQDGNTTNEQYLKREIKKSSFQRSFSLAENLSSEDIKATVDLGILTLTIKRILPIQNKPVVKSIEIE